MSRYVDHHVLTPARLANLRLIVDGTTRHPGGRPVIFARNQLEWFAEHGYIEPLPAMPPTDGPIAPRPRPVATQKGRDAVAAADAQRVPP